jgi:hypothetical protein
VAKARSNGSSSPGLIRGVEGAIFDIVFSSLLDVLLGPRDLLVTKIESARLPARRSLRLNLPRAAGAPAWVVAATLELAKLSVGSGGIDQRVTLSGANDRQIKPVDLLFERPPAQRIAARSREPLRAVHSEVRN